jgi:predicted KAP-like P-loop ATPase
MSEESGRTLITPLILNDEPVGRDEMAYFQFERYADTFARIIAARNTHTPLTIGVHGEWGSVKTTLMRRIQARLNETKNWESKPPSFVTVDERGPDFEKKFRPCRTIWFNTWKYGREEARVWRTLMGVGPCNLCCSSPHVIRGGVLCVRVVLLSH